MEQENKCPICDKVILTDEGEIKRAVILRLSKRKLENFEEENLLFKKFAETGICLFCVRSRKRQESKD